MRINHLLCFHASSGHGKRPHNRLLPARRDKEEFSVPLTQQMGDIGLFGMTVPEAYGGQGLDYISYIIAVEEVARIDGSQAATLAAGNSLGINPIEAFGSEAQKRKYLPDLCRVMNWGRAKQNAIN